MYKSFLIITAKSNVNFPGMTFSFILGPVTKSNPDLAMA